MIPNVDLEVRGEPVRTLCRVPGPPRQSVDIRSKHRAAMVQAKKRIKPDSLQLSKSGAATPSSFRGHMPCLRKLSLDPARILGILVGRDLHIRPQDWTQLLKEGLHFSLSLIFSPAILLPRDLGERTLGRHGSDSKTEDPAIVLLSSPDDKRDTQRKTFGLLKRLKLIKLAFFNLISFLRKHFEKL